jgi:hypothetical protein
LNSMVTTSVGIQRAGLCNLPLRASCRCLYIVVVLLVLTACGGSGITQTTETDRYTVRLQLEGSGFGQRTAMIELSDESGQPVVADEVVVSPVMEEMGMAAPEVPAQQVAPGRYEARGEFFSMLGEWQLLDVRVSAGGAEEVARFIVEATAV